MNEPKPRRFKLEDVASSDSVVIEFNEPHKACPYLRMTVYIDPKVCFVSDEDLTTCASGIMANLAAPLRDGMEQMRAAIDDSQAAEDAAKAHEPEPS